MANCDRFRNGFMAFITLISAVLLILSTNVNAYTGGGSFGGGGAGGSWDEPDKCEPEIAYQTQFNGSNPVFSSIQSACAYAAQRQAEAWAQSSGTVVSIDGLKCNVKAGSLVGTHVLKTVQNSLYDPSCEEKCPAGYEKDSNGKCQPKKCPVGETLVNGQCQKRQCPAGMMLDANGQCNLPDDSCPADQEMVNGQCRPKQCPAGYSLVNGTCQKSDDDDDCDPNDPNCPNQGFKLPPFCEWADVMCRWYEDWTHWSNLYAQNEEKANLDREELKRLALDSKGVLEDIEDELTAQSLVLNEQKLKLTEIKNQDEQFYNEIRLWLQNFNDEEGTPSEQLPLVEFPPFCDWAVKACDWFLDWDDWRTEYTADTTDIKAKLDAHLQRLQEIKQQDQEYYEEASGFFDKAQDFFDEVLAFFDEIRAHMAGQGGSGSDEDGDVEAQQPNIVPDTSSRIQYINACPAGEQFSVTFMGRTTNLEFSYQPLCQFMSMIRPFVIGIAYLLGAYIIMGLSRGSAD